jgi:hypothetical protein
MHGSEAGGHCAHRQGAFPSNVAGPAKSLLNYFMTCVERVHATSCVPESQSVVMQIGGWKTRSAFDRYNIVSKRDLVEAAGKLEGNFQGTQSLSLRKLMI